MKREAARTLHSLVARATSSDIDDLDYEVIVVENGSDPDQRLGEEFVTAASGPSSATSTSARTRQPSPVFALNHGDRRCRAARPSR